MVNIPAFTGPRNWGLTAGPSLCSKIDLFSKITVINKANSLWCLWCENMETMEIHKESSQHTHSKSSAPHTYSEKGNRRGSLFLSFYVCSQENKLPPGMWLESRADLFTCQTRCTLPRQHLEKREVRGAEQMTLLTAETSYETQRFIQIQKLNLWMILSSLWLICIPLVKKLKGMYLMKLMLVNWFKQRFSTKHWKVLIQH